jgi:hypothetical protein
MSGAVDCPWPTALLCTAARHASNTVQARVPGEGPCQARRVRTGTGRHPPLTCGTDEIVDCAWLSAAAGAEVPVIAAWIAVQIACETLG